MQQITQVTVICFHAGHLDVNIITLVTEKKNPISFRVCTNLTYIKVKGNKCQAPVVLTVLASMV